MFYPRDNLPIPLRLMKGLMGFQISEPTAEELTTLDHIPITNDAVWQPQSSIDVLTRSVVRTAKVEPTLRVQWDPELQHRHKKTANIGGIYYQKFPSLNFLIQMLTVFPCSMLMFMMMTPMKMLEKMKCPRTMKIME